LRAIRTACLLVVLGVLGPGLALGQENSPTAPAPAASPATEPPATEPPAALPTPAPQQSEAPAQALPEPPSTLATPASPALNLSQPPVAADQDEPLVEKWWFWSAIGAVVIGTVVAIVLIDGGSSTPRTTLGNQEFRP
jgi:hypothetical protein